MAEKNKPTLFKNLSSVGLPETGKDWQPELFMKKWVSIIRASKLNATLDIVAEPQHLIVKDEDGEDAYLPLPAGKPLDHNSIKKLFIHAFSIFRRAMDTLYKDKKEAFVKTEIQIVELYNKVKKPQEVGDAWAEIEAYIDNEYTEWLLSEAVPTKSKTRKKTDIIPFPQLLKKPEYVEPINNWLEENEVIEKNDADPERPYRWIAKNSNWINEIKGRVETKKGNYKTRPYSDKYHLGALGLYLYEKCDCFKRSKYVAMTVARSVLSYYTDLNLNDENVLDNYRQAFSNNEEYRMEYTDAYYELFSGLERKIQTYKLQHP